MEKDDNLAPDVKKKAKEQKEKSENPDPDVDADSSPLAAAKKACKEAAKKVDNAHKKDLFHNKSHH